MTFVPTVPQMIPAAAAPQIAITTVIGSLNANGARSPGTGDAVPGALLMIPSVTAMMPEKPPAKKLHE